MITRVLRNAAWLGLGEAGVKSGLLLARWVDDAAHRAITGVMVKNNIFFIIRALN